MSQPEGIKKSISLIIAHYRGDKSLRKFAAEINEILPDPISHQTVKNWQDQVHIPDWNAFYVIACIYSDWRRSMAVKIMNVLKPDMHNPDLAKSNDDRDIQ